MAEVSAGLMDEIGRLDPKTAAERLIRAQQERSAWLDAFAEHLDRQRRADALTRIMAVWVLNQAETARAFGVSRQAINKWCADGVPAERANAIADVAAATDLLVRHLRRDRIAAVVRRSAPMLDNLSLLELLQRREYQAVLQGCRDMFEFVGAHR